MSNIKQNAGDEAEFAKPLYTPIKRRSFFMYAGATAGATALLLSGCDDDKDEVVPAGTISLGSGDVGVLNYAYALEQLEAAFYAQVKDTPATDFKTNELAYFTQVAAHEAIHRDFFKAAINRDAPGKIIPSLQASDLNFSSVDFTKRDSVLAAAKTFEDLGVAAYNGAGKYLKTPAYLVIAGQIVSVEARHAAYVRDLISNGSFADDSIIDSMGLDKAMEPVDVIAAAQPFIKVKLDATSVGK
ncbi:ferritin-like domain-containing protein [Hymenobacter sp. NST-14]|uniref:ferritin-like domain-containing protein n=1 Tax=Hymenobacter piscis TaxID=2839984 RepID=UPI001C02E586|nr:ferritin-like domain-containing protein [Hymenobacter piscis]MBT9391873.1 ferritin-like domain-containing protein [Hymenobacter piscis]